MSDSPNMTPPPAPPAPPTPGAPAADSSGKILAGLGYLIGIVALVALLIEPYKSDMWVREHAIQGLAIWVLGMIVGWVPIIGWLLDVALFVVAIIGAINAFQGQRWEIPFLGPMLRDWFRA